MKKLIALFLLATAAFAQTAAFPGAVATNANLGVSKNLVSTTLSASISATATSFTVASATNIVANEMLTMGTEIVWVCGVSGTTITVGKSTCPHVDGRGFDIANGGGAATVHTSGTPVKGYVTAWHPNALAAEVKAIETTLGANLSNIWTSFPLPAVFGPSTGVGIPGADNPYTAPTILSVRNGTSAAPNTTATPGMVFQQANALPSNIGQGAVFDCYSTAAARPGFSGGCITLTNVIHDLTIAKGGTANRNTVYADAPPAVSAVANAINAAGTITVTTGSAHLASTGDTVIIGGTSGMTGLNATVASVTVTSPTTFTFSCGGCGAGPGSGGTVTIPAAYYASWDSVFKVSGPQLRIVGHESDMNNQYGDAGASVAAQDATFNYALYCSSHNCTTGIYMDSGDGAGKYYHPIQFGANALVAAYPYIDSSAGPSTVDFAWIGNNQFVRWSDSTAGRWPLLGLDSTDNFRISAPTNQYIFMGPNLTSLLLVGSSAVSHRTATTQTKATNYIASETGGANNAIAGVLLDATGTAVATADGLCVIQQLGHTLQAGANTYALNGGAAVSIKKHTNAATDLGTAYAATGRWFGCYNSTGPVWMDMSQ